MPMEVMEDLPSLYISFFSLKEAMDACKELSQCCVGWKFCPISYQKKGGIELIGNERNEFGLSTLDWNVKAADYDPYKSGCFGIAYRRIKSIETSTAPSA